jgi:saccharopine dehydrogenase (NAD+, L-lysine-forming)
MSTFLIYGANGYTGRLVAEHAVERGLKPILAGRRASELAPLAERLGLEHRLFALDDIDAVARGLDGVALVLHCAGPFSKTSAPMLEACLRAGVHYLDITGEIAVFEAVHRRSPELARRGVTAIPGVGFDVVPTDGMAGMLAEALPTARRLELAFAGLGGGLSRGTARTAVEGLGKGGAARIGGRIVSVPNAWRTRTVELGGKPRTVVSIPWGDVSTAWYTTGIPDITTYTLFPSSAIRMMRLTRPLTRLLDTAPVQRLLTAWVDRNIHGPTEDQRQTGRSFVWGRVEDDDGRYAEGHLSTPEGYRLTALSSVAAAERVLAGGVPPGALTPTKAFGTGFVRGLDGVVVDPIRTGSVRR